MTFFDDLIYDVGMHDGQDSAFYLARGFRVLAIEADPVQAEAARHRFEKEISDGRMTILNVALADREKTAQFWINDELPHLNSFDQSSASRMGGHAHAIEVECTRLDSVLSKYGLPYYLKIDIEGADLDCCNQLTSTAKPPFVSVEMSRMELIQRLVAVGYDSFKLVDQRTLWPEKPVPIPLHVRALRLAFRLANFRKENRSIPLRLQRFAAARVLQAAAKLGLWGTHAPFVSNALKQWKFTEGCSGTFGSDLPDSWLTADQAGDLWKRNLKEYQKMGLEYWVDLHATQSAPDRPV